MNGSQYIAEFLKKKKLDKIFLVTGGAVAFIVDAIGKKNYSKLYCFQHEQSASMAADTTWRCSNGKKIGVSMATSGPGAVNLLSGLGCSYVDSIPSLSITGQVNIKESSKYGYAKLRQAGYQEIDIVKMAKSVTKFSIQVNSAHELKYNLEKAYHIATSGRMGPVLIDVPMDIQQLEVGEYEEFNFSDPSNDPSSLPSEDILKIKNFFKNKKRPLVLFGAGVGLSGTNEKIINWINNNDIPFVSSWSAFSFFDHNNKNYFGHIGVYGNRGANFILQNCDSLLVLGSRLDSRVRSSKSSNFAPLASKLVIDVDNEELRKYHNDEYSLVNNNIKHCVKHIQNMKLPRKNNEWFDYINDIKKQYFGKDISTFAKENKTLSPYKAVMEINKQIKKDSIVLGDCGAHLCWLYQVFKRTTETIFTAAGFGPIGYAHPAAIGAAATCPEKKIISFSGDGSFQVQTSELQVMKHHNMNICNIVMNDNGYAIVKQFQDSYMGSRYFGSGIKDGYSVPDIKKVAEAYGLTYIKIKNEKDLKKFRIPKGISVVEVVLAENTLIEPKTEMGRPLNDQFPFMKDKEFHKNNRFVKFDRVKKIVIDEVDSHE
tara:strand:- start:2968 stop:4761 length:1794 start_codon:yes stop_codon:yes gene_type:complete